MIGGGAGDNVRIMTRPALRLAIPMLTALIAACTPFESLWKKPPGAPQKAAAAVAPKPELPLGEATHRFLIAPDQDVVGHAQVTVSKVEPWKSLVPP